MKNLCVIPLLLLLLLLISCQSFDKAIPIPPDKGEFVGIWKTSSGFIIEITANGLANLSHDLNETDPDYDKLCIKVGPSVILDMFMMFDDDNTFIVRKPSLYAKVYKIECPPYQENNQTLMVLNGVTFIKQ